MTARVSVALASRILGRSQADVRRCLDAEGWATAGHIATLEGQRQGIVTMEDQMLVLGTSGRRKQVRVLRITGKGLDLLSRCLERLAAA